MTTTRPDPRHPTERIYDELMAPRVAELITIATKHGIPLFLSAGMIFSDGNPGACTTKVGRPDDQRLFGIRHQHAWCSTIVQGEHWQTAATARITHYHNAPPNPAEQPDATCKQQRCAWCPTCNTEEFACDEDRCCHTCGTDLVLLADRHSLGLAITERSRIEAELKNPHHHNAPAAPTVKP